MEVEMEDDNSSNNTAVEFTFTAVEFDVDYEFDAPRFFDFAREESVHEASDAELWFDSAQSYPPSRKLLLISYCMFLEIVIDMLLIVEIFGV
ncbi:hypothetical protein Hdeb2414_s0009g00311521 [Helianthus debilis subsp. tardiflorus]